MKLYIKNMVCQRCKTIVKAELDKIGVHYDAVELGEVTIKEKISSVLMAKGQIDLLTRLARLRSPPRREGAVG